MGGVAHWLIILGVMQEKTPLVITIYFHSLAGLSPLAGVGLCLIKKWGRSAGMVIAFTQIPAHTYMLYLEAYRNWNSRVATWERGIDIAFAIFYIIYFCCPKVKDKFES